MPSRCFNSMMLETWRNSDIGMTSRVFPSPQFRILKVLKMNLQTNLTDLHDKTIMTKMSLGEMGRAGCIAESAYMSVFYLSFY